MSAAVFIRYNVPTTCEIYILDILDFKYLCFSVCLQFQIKKPKKTGTIKSIFRWKSIGRTFCQICDWCVFFLHLYFKISDYNEWNWIEQFRTIPLTAHKWSLVKSDTACLLLRITENGGASGPLVTCIKFMFASYSKEVLLVRLLLKLIFVALVLYRLFVLCDALCPVLNIPYHHMDHNY